MSEFYKIGATCWPGIGKLVEESGEVQQVAGKLLGTGGQHLHWDGTNLVERLEDELADLQAAIDFVIAQNKLNAGRVEARRIEKLATFRLWQEGEAETRGSEEPGVEGARVLAFLAAKPGWRDAPAVAEALEMEEEEALRILHYLAEQGQVAQHQRRLHGRLLVNPRRGLGRSHWRLANSVAASLD